MPWNDSYSLLASWQISSTVLLNEQAWKIMQIVLHCMFAAFTIIGNGSVIITILNTHYLRTVHNRHLVSLAFVDTLTGFIMLYYVSGIVWPSLRLEKHFCIGNLATVLLVLTLSQTVILCSAVDCYLSLWYPIQYLYMGTAWRVNVAMFGTWLYGFGITAIPFYTWSTWSPGVQCLTERVLHMHYVAFHLLQFACVYLGVIIIFTCVAYEMRRKSGVMVVHKQKWRQRQLFEERRRRDVEHCKALAIIASISFISWATYVTSLTMHIFLARCWWTQFLEELGLLVTAFHSGINPFIYYWKIKTFHLGFYKMYCCCVLGRFPKRAMNSVALHRVSFKNGTGSMLQLHTTMDGKLVRVPRIVVTDVDSGTCMPGMEQMEYTDMSEDLDNVWFSSSSLELTNYRAETYTRNTQYDTLDTALSDNYLSVPDDYTAF